MLQYWFCEHVVVIEPTNGMEKETPRVVRWELHNINIFIDNNDLSQIAQEKVSRSWERLNAEIKPWISTDKSEGINEESRIN